MLSDSDETRRLLNEVGNGQQLAFDRLFAMHRDYLKQVIRVYLYPNSRFDESDVVQETHIYAYKRFDHYLTNRPMPFKLWLRKTAQQLLASLLRLHHAERRNVDRQKPLANHSSVLIAQQLVGKLPSPSETVSRRQTIEEIRQALDLLSPADRDMLILRHYEGLSHREIAEILEIEEVTARKRYGRVLLRFQKLLVQQGVSESDL